MDKMGEWTKGDMLSFRLLSELDLKIQKEHSLCVY